MEFKEYKNIIIEAFPELELNFDSHKWELVFINNTSIYICSVCNIDIFEFMAPYRDLTCGEICIKHII